MYKKKEYTAIIKKLFIEESNKNYINHIKFSAMIKI